MSLLTSFTKDSGSTLCEFFPALPPLTGGNPRAAPFPPLPPLPGGDPPMTFSLTGSIQPSRQSSKNSVGVCRKAFWGRKVCKKRKALKSNCSQRIQGPLNLKVALKTPLKP